MAADIVPELYEKIRSDFERNMKSSKWIQTFQGKLEKKTAQAADVFAYSSELGDCASDALCRNLTEQALPDGKLYWNIAERTIKELLKAVHKMVNEAAAAVQKFEDEKIGVNLNPVTPAFPEDRINDLMDKLIGILEEDERST